ncbi:hypothetical protein ACO7_360009 [Thiomonas arsenitoxydans]|nr:hypothetical protein ACO7_360009 [Thiomonas arsenitoxydans]CQR33734.1 hypothetical protein ACO3_380009 [Thiomonas arsenitoxydans]
MAWAAEVGAIHWAVGKGQGSPAREGLEDRFGNRHRRVVPTAVRPACSAGADRRGAGTFDARSHWHRFGHGPALPGYPRRSHGLFSHGSNGKNPARHVSRATNHRRAFEGRQGYCWDIPAVDPQRGADLSTPDATGYGGCHRIDRRHVVQNASLSLPLANLCEELSQAVTAAALSADLISGARGIDAVHDTRIEDGPDSKRTPRNAVPNRKTNRVSGTA